MGRKARAEQLVFRTIAHFFFPGTKLKRVSRTVDALLAVAGTSQEDRARGLANRPRKGRNKMKHSHLVGKAEEMVTVFGANAAVLVEAGVVVKDLVKDISDRKDDVVAKTAERDGLQTAAKDKTAEVNAATVALYEAFSSKIDHVVGAVGKKSNLAKQFKKLRNGLLGKSGNNTAKAAAAKAAPAPQPSAAPAAATDATGTKAA